MELKRDHECRLSLEVLLVQGSGEIMGQVVAGGECGVNARVFCLFAFFSFFFKTVHTMLKC
jgi:hypothetical protein